MAQAGIFGGISGAVLLPVAALGCGVYELLERHAAAAKKGKKAIFQRIGYPAVSCLDRHLLARIAKSELFKDGRVYPLFEQRLMPVGTGIGYYVKEVSYGGETLFRAIFSQLLLSVCILY